MFSTRHVLRSVPCILQSHVQEDCPPRWIYPTKARAYLRYRYDRLRWCSYLLFRCRYMFSVLGFHGSGGQSASIRPHRTIWIHLWISDPAALDLTDDQRRALVSALAVVEGGKETVKKVDVRITKDLPLRCGARERPCGLSSDLSFWMTKTASLPRKAGRRCYS